ncbi:MAG TPA: RluA family pseudouridine synthase [Flavipsychrobacter sp.]|nr:RluA family pseudouridine synthase [Flavipsychrobacter sp.]
MRIDTLFEDDDLIIVNKPAGVLVIPDRFDPNIASLNKLLEEQVKQKLYVVHRLDRDTSGVICFAKNEATHKYLSKLFMERDVKKYYMALVTGRIHPPEGLIDRGIAEHPTIKGKMVITAKGKPSQTGYIVKEQWALYALVQLELHTGRTHQIRVHLQSIGNPVVADEVYGDGKPFFLSAIKKKYRLSEKEEAERPLLSRLALHACRLEFVKEDGTAVKAEAPLPKDMAACVNQLNKWSR